MPVDFNQAMLGVVTDLRNLQASDTITWAIDGTITTDPAALDLPGVLVRLVAIRRETLGAWAVDLQLVLIASDTDTAPGPGMALSNMMYALLDAYAQPDGPVTPVTVQLPMSPAPMPGLVFPLTVRRNEE